MLLLELLRRHKEQDIAIFGCLLDGAERGDAESAFDGYLKDLGGDTGWARFDIELQLYAARNPAFATDYDALQSRTRGGLAHLIAALFDKADKRPPASPGDLAALFVVLVHGLVLQRARDPGAAVKLVFESLMATAEPA